ncbi:MAG: hypothetical protein ACQERK_07365 [Campylobacterota bacterium]
MVLSLLFTGCADKNFTEKSSAHIVLKTPKLRYSDMGFIAKNSSRIQAQIYNMATPVFTLKINRNICINNACFKPKHFNDKYLHPKYPPGLLENIFRAKPVAGGKNRTAEAEGFSQKISSYHYDIIYTVNKKQIRFADKKNNILIQIRYMQ